ncbi:MAG: NTP transferase domain-containing protein [Ancrocorticia sp.]
MCGVVLAAGAGTRFGGPKALARQPDGTPWLELAVRRLEAAGCSPILVVLGAASDDAAPLVPLPACTVVATKWFEGLGESLCTALTWLGEPGGYAGSATDEVRTDPISSSTDDLAEVQIGTPTKTLTKSRAQNGMDPQFPTEVKRQVPAKNHADAMLVITVDTPDMPAAACARLMQGASTSSLARAVYGGKPGHPVLIGREHWAALELSAAGDTGAGPYLRRAGALEIECADLWHGHDIDYKQETDNGFNMNDGRDIDSR